MKFIHSFMAKVALQNIHKKWFEEHKSISISVVFTKKQCRKKCLPNIIYDGLLLFSCPAFQILIQKSTKKYQSTLVSKRQPSKNLAHEIYKGCFYGHPSRGNSSTTNMCFVSADNKIIYSTRAFQMAIELSLSTSFTTSP